jgi:hypothetical protein
MATWRLAQSLVVLRNEVNVYAPKRKKTYDGTIGDQAHAARASSHNPNKYGVVTGMDITHDPAGGMDCAVLFEYLRTHPHPELRYVIFNRKVARRSNGWKVTAYTGANPHTGHLHATVGTGTDGNPLPPYDSTASWGIAAMGKEEDMNEAQTRALIQEELKAYTEWGGTQQEIKDAEAHLMKHKLISRGRAPAKALTWGLFALLLSRVLKLLGKP